MWSSRKVRRGMTGRPLSWLGIVASSALWLACADTRDDAPPDFAPAPDMPDAPQASADAGSHPLEPDTPSPTPMLSPMPTACREGIYEGEYVAVFVSTLDPLALEVPIVGPQRFDLESDAEWIDEDSEFPMLVASSSARFESSFLEPAITTQADLTGGIDCTTLEFRVESSACVWQMLGLPGGDCMVRFVGSYDPTTDAVNGDFEFTADTEAGDPIGFGHGTFTLSRNG